MKKHAKIHNRDETLFSLTCVSQCPSRNGGFRFRPRPQRFRNRRRSEATPRIAKSENAGMGRKTPFMDDHYPATNGAAGASGSSRALESLAH